MKKKKKKQNFSSETPNEIQISIKSFFKAKVKCIFRVQESSVYESHSPLLLIDSGLMALIIIFRTLSVRAGAGCGEQYFFCRNSVAWLCLQLREK